MIEHADNSNKNRKFRLIGSILLFLSLLACSHIEDEKPILVLAAREDLGKNRMQMGMKNRLWCGEAMNRWRVAAGLKPVNSALAVDQLRGAQVVRNPVVGSIMVSKRRKGHHVDIVTGFLPNGKIKTIGGNVSGRVVERVQSPHGAIFANISGIGGNK